MILLLVAVGKQICRVDVPVDDIVEHVRTWFKVQGSRFKIQPVGSLKFSSTTSKHRFVCPSQFVC
jgi:hypothetical protein